MLGIYFNRYYENTRFSLDNFVASGGWGEPELPFAKKMSALLEYYKHVAHQDKIEKARQKITKRRTNMYLMVRISYFPLCSCLLSDQLVYSGTDTVGVYYGTDIRQLWYLMYKKAS